MKVGVVGASGLVGRTIIRVLEEMDIFISELKLFASSRSAGSIVLFHQQPLEIQELTKQSFDQSFDYVFFSAGSQCSLEYAPISSANSHLVIDNSPAFRQDPKIPLVIPEINTNLLKGYSGIVANPNCAVIQLLKALSPIQSAYGLEQLVVTTFQSRSGAGQKGLTESSFFPKPIEENLIPYIGAILPDNSSEEEIKIIQESRKILGNDSLPIFPTTVRVPVRIGHSESVYLQTNQDFEQEEMVNLLKNQSFLSLQGENFTPQDTVGSNQTFVSRIRKAGPRRLMLWVMADNVRVGAATNAVNIMLAHQRCNIA